MYTRIESDSIGTMTIPSDAYFGVQSLRAKNNFNITGTKLNYDFIVSLAQIKKAAAITNMESSDLDLTTAKAIMDACTELIEGSLHDEFIVDAIQGGAGTSSNMNANEVIANRAIELLDGHKGNYTLVHPNDHVNMCQSTNDVYPSAGKLTILKLIPKLINELEKLSSTLDIKTLEFSNVIKMGRTQLQDAVPMKLSQSFNAYNSVIKRDITRILKASKDMRTLNLGGTAIGTCINASEYYVTHIIDNLKLVTGEKLYQADDLIDATQNLDSFVTISSAIKACAVNLSKMANDIRLLSSGPKAGIGELIIPSMQNGSSIMPGKINPVIPEVVTQVAFNIIGNDLTITMAAEGGQLELNAFEPILFYKLFESIETLSHAVNTFTNNCISGISANTEQCFTSVNESAGLATALCPYIGYKKSAEIAKECLLTNIPVKDIVLSLGLITEDLLDSILNPSDMTEVRTSSNKSTITKHAI